MNRKKIKHSNNGFVLVAVTLVMAALIILAIYFLNFVITDSKIAHSQNLSVKTYYLAEAGINETIWKIKNDPLWLLNFQTNPAWQASISRQNPFQNNQSYQVTVQNTDLGNAEVIATGSYNIGANQSQRIVKTTVFQAQGQSPGSPIPQIAIFANEQINLFAVNLNSNADIFTNDAINVSFFSHVSTLGKASAVQRINIDWSSTFTATAFEAINYPPPPSSQEMPQIDFDSSDPNSFLSRADYVYSRSQFDTLLQNNPNLQLTGIIYVRGNINIPRGNTLTINGTLVADGNIIIGDSWWPFWQTNPVIIINDPTSGPLGLLSKRQINIGTFAGSCQINGLVYANDQLKIDTYTNHTITGGVIARKLLMSGLWQTLTINHNDSFIARTLGTSVTAPIIDVEHWEEEY